MFEIRKTELFANWLDGMRDLCARARVQVKIERLAAGNPGDVQTGRRGSFRIADRLRSRLRVYFKRIGSEVVILLAGGDKRN